MNQPLTHATRALAAAVLVAALPLAGCASGETGGKGPLAGASVGNTVASRALALDRSRTRPLGKGERFRPTAISTPVRLHAPVGWLHCGFPSRRSYGAHVELFAEGHEIVIPAGIGVAPPQHRKGAVVEGGVCIYPLHTIDPTGVIRVERLAAGRNRPTVGDLFELWGQPLSSQRIASFAAAHGQRVSAFVDGRRVFGSVRAIPLRRHAQIVIELGPHVEPHPSYRFAPGL